MLMLITISYLEISYANVGTILDGPRENFMNADREHIASECPNRRSSVALRDKYHSDDKEECDVESEEHDPKI
uniref:Uncharacterized protein n=1 Tax=Solanum lycopersicum TaxID=4081 RepID=A0A3Q7J6C7_SOLLC